MTQEEKLQFKFKYDKLFDDVFFTSKFKQYIVEQCKRCPAGLTINTDIDDEIPEFHVCTKQYGHEHMGERVPGDYYDLKYGIGRDISEALMNYLAENAPELYEDMFSFGYKVKG